MKNLPIDLQWRQCCPDDSNFTFNPVFVNLAHNQDSQKISDEFGFQPHQTIHVRVTCPWVLKKPIFDFVLSILHSILTGSSSNLQVARTAINSRLSSNFGQIRLLTLVLLALECRKWVPYTYNGEKVIRLLMTSFLIGYSLYLQVTKAAIKSRKSSNFGQIRLFTSELFALESRKFFP